MRQIRHNCNSRLFDSRFTVNIQNGTAPDIAIKCKRCSRAEKKEVIAGFSFKLPKFVAPIPPEPIYCSDLSCMAHIADLSLPYRIVDGFEDVSIACKECGEITKLKISGVLEVGTPNLTQRPILSTL